MDFPVLLPSQVFNLILSFPHLKVLTVIGYALTDEGDTSVGLPAVVQPLTSPILTMSFQRGGARSIVHQLLSSPDSSIPLMSLPPATTSHRTVGSTFNLKEIWQACRSSIRPATGTILHDFNSVLRPGEMLRESIVNLPISRAISLHTTPSCFGKPRIWMYNIPQDDREPA